MNFLAAFLPSAIGLIGQKPWEAKPTQDQAPVVTGPDNTMLIVLGIVAMTVIVLLLIYLSKKV